jgi:hypothetical protein
VKTVKILGVDPGGTTGLAWFNDDYKLDSYAQVSLEDLPIWFERHTPVPDLIVLENYRLWKHRALQQAGSSLPAAQAIGMVKAYGKIRGIPIVEQSPQILESAQKMSGYKMKGLAHSKTHWIAAANHVYWYMVKNDLVKVYIPEEDRL